MIPLRGFWPLAVFVVLAPLLAVGLKLNPREVPSPFIGKPAPGFTLPRLDAPAQSVSASEFKGQVWLLNIWASWCGPCRDEHPLLLALAREQKIPIVGLNYKDDPVDAKDWLRQLGDPFRIIVADRSGRAGIEWGVYGVPETFLIDRQGIIRYRHVGPLTRKVWTDELLPLIRKFPL